MCIQYRKGALQRLGLMGSIFSIRKTRVFVVDDEPNLADTLALILSNEGFLVSTFYNAQDANERAQQEAPDIVLSDIHMPNMDGITLASKLHEKLPRCRIVLISGNATNFSTQVSELNDNGWPELELLSKPVPPEIIIRKLTAMAAGNA